jgi:hypothetical protein
MPALGDSDRTLFVALSVLLVGGEARGWGKTSGLRAWFSFTTAFPNSPITRGYWVTLSHGWH